MDGGIRDCLEVPFNKTVKKVGDDVENLKFNTAIAALMSLINDIYDTGSVTKEELKVFTVLLNLFAPHICEELWDKLAFGGKMVCEQPWPAYDESKCVDKTVEIVLQINGKVRSHMEAPADIGKDEALAAAKNDAKISAGVDGKKIIKEIYVPGKLINIVAK